MKTNIYKILFLRYNPSRKSSIKNGRFWNNFYIEPNAVFSVIVTKNQSDMFYPFLTCK